MRDNKNASQLLEKYRQGNCTEAELALLESWYLNYKDQPVPDLSPELLDAARNEVWSTLPVHEPKKTLRLWPMVAAAASVVLILTAGLFFFKNIDTPGATNSAPEITKILPGGNKAVLTLADGSKISLTDIKEGALAKQSGITITKAKDGQLIYTVDQQNSAQSAGQPVGLNTITTPRGGKYEVNLPDGTKVILNAVSSLTYPTKFVGNERRVSLTGEAYFEVAPNQKMPFKVESDQQVTEVLGTHFNINAYDDEQSVKTTLLEGKVRVTINNNTSVVIHPGQQAIAKGNDLKIDKVNTDDIIAWTSNTFVFDSEDLGSIMRKISRWYNVEVVCSPELAKMEFGGTISRQRDIKDVLKIMEMTETVHFKFEGRRITVMP